MNERSNEARLKHLAAPAPDPQARARIKQAALAEFARVHAVAANEAAGDSTESSTAQASDDSTRLSRSDKRSGRTAMYWPMKLLVPRSVFGAFASACVIAFATAMLWPTFSRTVGREQWPVVDVPTATAEVPLDLDALQPPLDVMPVTPGAAIEPKPDSRTGLSPTDVRARMAVGPKPVPLQGGDAVLAKSKDELGQITVTGERAAITNALEVKRQDSSSSIQAIVAEDVGQFPNQSYPEAMKRVAGVQVASGKAAAPAVAGQLSSRSMVLLPETVASIQGQFEVEGDDKFLHFDINPVKLVANEADRVSTFSVDVDTASYSFVRRMLNAAVLPQKDAVRVEEMVNYFDYAWPKAKERALPFEPTIAVSDSPWTKGKKLVHIGIKGYDVPRDKAPDVNVVLLLDVSGSMNSPDKLPLAIQSMELLLSSLKPTDTVGIVVYAGAAGKVLDPTPVADKQKILGALRELRAGGSTAGAEGIELAYQLAEKHFRKGGVNRILLATDGDFNVGIDGTEELKGFVERKRKNGIMLSVLGFGQGNYRDELAQALAQNGNGVAAYIDTLSEAQKVLVQESSGSLFTIAKDVKVQVEFNPATVVEYRLIGYETRALKREDFNNDAVDAGDVGSGHTVTAIYEITPAGSSAVSVDPLRYAQGEKPQQEGSRNEYGFLKIRYKLPDESTSRLISRPIPLETNRLPALVQREVQFSTAVAGFAQLLRGGKYTGSLTLDDVLAQAQAAKGEDEYGYRTEFVQLVRKAKTAKEM